MPNHRPAVSEQPLFYAWQDRPETGRAKTLAPRSKPINPRAPSPADWRVIAGAGSECPVVLLGENANSIAVRIPEQRQLGRQRQHRLLHRALGLAQGFRMARAVARLPAVDAVPCSALAQLHRAQAFFAFPVAVRLIAALPQRPRPARF